MIFLLMILAGKTRIELAVAVGMEFGMAEG